jgi:hypothetical protein
MYDFAASYAEKEDTIRRDPLFNAVVRPYALVRPYAQRPPAFAHSDR